MYVCMYEWLFIPPLRRVLFYLAFVLCLSVSRMTHRMTQKVVDEF